MDYTPVTPFRRPVDAALMKHQADAAAPLPPQGANKWEVLRELGAARVRFGLSDRDLTVLQALISFHPATVLGGNSDELVVHPSNKSICERLNGMPCSTMRRHLAHLVQAGFVLRRDSPNGKRYARRYGEEKLVFGFDLSPLVRRFEEVCGVAEEVRAAEERFARLRASVSLMRRDLQGLAEFGRETRPGESIWDQFGDLAVLTARALRRKLSLSELEILERDVFDALEKARNVLDPFVSEDMSTNESINEHHFQNSNEDSYDLEPCFEKAMVSDGCAEQASEGALSNVEDISALDGHRDDSVPTEHENRSLPNVPLGLVLSVCQEFKTYSEHSVRHWHDLVRVAERVRPMMGISPSAWSEACDAMGPEEAGVVVVAMLERFDEIQSPGGYLRSLTRKAEAGAFSCGPMIMALMRRAA